MRGGLEYCRASPRLPCHQQASFAVKPAGTMTNDVFRKVALLLGYLLFSDISNCRKILVQRLIRTQEAISTPSKHPVTQSGHFQSQVRFFVVFWSCEIRPLVCPGFRLSNQKQCDCGGISKYPRRELSTPPHYGPKMTIVSDMAWNKENVVFGLLNLLLAKD
jgi:hypothetical protein